MSRLLPALALLLALAPAAQAAPVRTERVEAELHAESVAALPGKPATVGLRLKMDEHWHTYWRNPGDSGLPRRSAGRCPRAGRPGPSSGPTPRDSAWAPS